LRKFAGQWRKSLESVKWTQNILSPALTDVYEEAGLSIDGVFITNLALLGGSREKVNPK